MPAPSKIVCMQCDKPEDSCQCDRYCSLCKADYGVRLCEDGIYYCPDCREACDLKLANERA